jgi:hypothetical protein
MVSAGWWPGAPQQQRQHAIAGRMLALPDGTWWLFGAWARWYRWHPADRQWYLCPPPQAVVTRASGRPARPGAPLPSLPPHVLPAGPDFEYEGPAPLPFVGQEVSPELSSRVRATVEAAAALPAEDYPHWWALFPSSVPSTVAATWGAMLWCAAAPVFDSRLDEQMLGLWAPYRARPLPRLDGPRWLTPPPLEALIGLYAERLRSGRVDAAVVVLRTMWAVVSALRGDPRFQARADALLAILGATLSNPTMDYGALPYGDQALVQQWLTRCPPQLAPAIRIESSPGDNFRHAYYELAQAVAAVSGDPANPAYIEPRLVAAALIAADLAVVRQDVTGKVIPWLDPEIRYTVQAVLSQSGHPLRGLWPKDHRLPDVLRTELAGDERGGRARDVLLAAMYAADLAWCRLGGGIPARPRGFPVPTAAVAELIGVDRAKAAASAQPITPPPGIAPMAQEYPPANEAQAVPPADQPGFPPPAGRPGQAPGAPAGDPAAGGYGQGGYGQGAEPAEPAAAAAFGMPAAPEQSPPPAAEPPPPEQPPVPGPPPVETAPDVPEPVAKDPPAPAAGPPVPPAPPARGGGPLGTRIISEETSPDYERPAAERPGTRIMSETMVGDLMDAPMPEQPVGEIEPPPDALALPVVERFGIRFVCGAETAGKRGGAAIERDAGRLLDDLADRSSWPKVRPHDQAAQAADPGLDVTSIDDTDAGSDVTAVDAPEDLDPDADADVPSMLLVGSPHTGQRRLARMIALALAQAGVGDGTVRTAHADDVRAAPTDEITTVLGGATAQEMLSGDRQPDQDGAIVLFERLDTAIMEAFEPAAVAAAVLRMRIDNPGALIATCEPRAFRRLATDHPDLVAAFRVFRLPGLTEADARLTLLYVLADERRVTIDAAGLEAVRADLDRLRGPGELVNARLVETYLERACHRHVGRAGASRDRLVLTAEDFAGVAAEIEPALRQPADVDGFLRELDELVGLDAVKEFAAGLVEEARAKESDAAVRHLVFAGPPGVGKATVAGLLGGVYAALGVLDSGHLVACRPVHLAGRDAVDTEIRVSAMVEQAMGGVLLIKEAERLGRDQRTGSVTTELLKHMAERRGEFMVVCCTSAPDAMAGLLNAEPDFGAEFGEPVDFAPFTDRQLVRIFQRFAERDLYLLDEELRVELLARFARMREEPGFSYAITVRQLFDETVARQANRLAGLQAGPARPGSAEVTATTVARLTARDLPETQLERIMGRFHEDPGQR